MGKMRCKESKCRSLGHREERGEFHRLQMPSEINPTKMEEGALNGKELKKNAK